MKNLKEKIAAKAANAKKNGLLYLLTEEDVSILLAEAGITSEQWCYEGYHLARYEDKGNYEKGNCRFVPRSVNFAEKKVSHKMRIASAETLRKYNKANPMSVRLQDPQKLKKLLSNLERGRAIAAENKRLKEQDLKDRYERIKHLDIRKYGFFAEAARILGVSATHVRRLLKLWKQFQIVE